MRFVSILLLCSFVPLCGLGQQAPTGATLQLNDLVAEALRNNPEIQGSLHQVDAMHARVGQAGSLDDPELTYMREGMPGFHWNEASMQKIELMQTFRFPSKLSKESDIAEIGAEHSHHEHFEKELEIVTRLKSAYYELWFVQQSRALNQENSRLLKQFASIARTKFGVGEASLQDVLKADVELAKLQNQEQKLQQQEQSAKAMLIAILNRKPDDPLGVAVLADSVGVTLPLDTLQQLALHTRPMLLHDSLAVEESRAMLSLSEREYLPDLRLGVQYVTVPVGDFRGWSIIAGVSLPFAPWTLGKTSSRVDEATATVSRSSAALNASSNMVLSNVKDSYLKSQSAKRQLDSYRTVVLPQAHQSLKASLTAYQNGRTDFLMLIDAYRTLVELSMESLMVRMQFEQAVAELERQVGVPAIVSNK
jgi:cobalt-zinc-cadmium efflux system outer membrane protein